MSSNIKNKFLFYLEHFYRNFGNEWSIDEFPKDVTKNKDVLVTFLLELQEKGIIKLLQTQINTLSKVFNARSSFKRFNFFQF